MRIHLRRALHIIIIVAFLILFLNFYVGKNSSDDTRRAPDISAQAVHIQIEEHRSVYPNEEFYSDDRIVSQLTFVPQSVKNGLKEGSIKLKKILVYNGLPGWGIQAGQKTFLEQKCSVPYCELTDSRSDIAAADVILFTGISAAYEKKQPHQKWVMFLLEAPYHSPDLSGAAGLINWTATYRHDSTIVAPYEKFVPYNASILTKQQDRNYAAGKTKKVAWFVSNCSSRNHRRDYATELAKYIQVDIYGSCGSLTCSRINEKACFDMLSKDYKFYLSFENSNCRDYITEKFFVNGLKQDVIPIVMGAAPEDYERAAPPHSYIHVEEFESPKELAEYLHKLDKDDALYNEYFQWKGTGDIINTFFWCRMCAMAHDEDRGPSWYPDLQGWWRGDNICIDGKRWKDIKRSKKLIAELPIVLPPNQ